MGAITYKLACPTCEHELRRFTLVYGTNEPQPTDEPPKYNCPVCGSAMTATKEADAK